MNYLYEGLEKPTRLYIKQCPHCGLKYFGKSTRQNVEKYQGSGKIWSRHIKKHNVKPIHLWNSEWYYNTSIIRFALKFSKINKIVESSNWANIKNENGLDGGWDHISWDEDRKIKRSKDAKISAKINWSNQKYRDTLIPKNLERLNSKDVYEKRLNTLKEKYPKSAFYGKNHSEEWKRNHSETMKIKSKGSNNSNYGKKYIYSLEEKRSISIPKEMDVPEGWFLGRKIKFE